MKHEIIKTDNYLLVVEETNVPKIGKWYYNSDNGNLFVIVNDYPIPKSDIVISHLPLNGSPILEGVDLLPTLEDDVDVEKKANVRYDRKNSEYDEDKNLLCGGFIDGYNQAIEDNKNKKYTEEDLREALSQAFMASQEGYQITSDEIIQSLSQPKMPIGFDLQIGVCERWLNEDCTDNCCGIPEKKITTTTPEGHTQWIGTYLYADNT